MLKDRLLAIIILIVICFALLFTYLHVLRYKSFFSYEWEDEATHHQLVWNTVHGRWFYNSIGISGYYFSYHFQPVILLQSLVYGVFPHIYIFYFIISFSLGMGAIPLYLLAKRIFQDPLPAFLISLSYLLYAPLHNINFCDGDPIIFTIPILLFLLLFLEMRSFVFRRGTILGFLLLGIAALMCKEDISFTFIFFGAYFIFIKKGKWALACFVLALVWLSISLPIVIWLNQKQSLVRSIYYGSFNELVLMPFIRTKDFFLTLFSNDHLKYLWRILMPVSFLPLFSGISIGSLSGILELILGRGNIKYSQVYFLSPAIPFLFVGTVYSIRKISNLIYTKMPTTISANKIVILFSLSVLLINIANLRMGNILGSVGKGKIVYDKRFLNVNNIFDPVVYSMDNEDKIAWNFISLIPRTASVSASGDLLPALSARSNLKELFNNDYDYLDSDYLLFHTKYIGFGAGDYCKPDDDQFMFKLIEDLKNDPRWILIREEQGFVLFKRK